MFEFKDYYEKKAFPRQPESFLYFLLQLELRKKRPKKQTTVRYFQKHKICYRKMKCLVKETESIFGDLIGIEEEHKEKLKEIEEAYKKFLQYSLDKIATYHDYAPSSVLKQIVGRKFFELDLEGRETPRKIVTLIRDQIGEDLKNLGYTVNYRHLANADFYHAIYKVFTNHYSSEVLTIGNDRKRFKAKLDSVVKKRLPASNKLL